jgi:transposase
MADPVVREIMFALNGGDFLTRPEQSPQVARALDIAAHSITLVDNLFDALVQEHEDAVEGQRYALIDIPELAQKARAAVDAARQAVQGLDRDGPERSVEEARSR